ncbi:MAG: hypothetical protein J3K34DRAFT_195239 [Monoraphidium minutum]|nr:MAG: hypothetical protein J3K34DRAFT_195239 [Monoraphidium minutum]
MTPAPQGPRTARRAAAAAAAAARRARTAPCLPGPRPRAPPRPLVCRPAPTCRPAAQARFMCPAKMQVALTLPRSSEMLTHCGGAPRPATVCRGALSLGFHQSCVDGLEPPGRRPCRPPPSASILPCETSLCSEASHLGRPFHLSLALYPSSPRAAEPP